MSHNYSFDERQRKYGRSFGITVWWALPAILFFIFPLQPASAHISKADTSSYSILPNFGYNSDIGFAGGGTVNRMVFDPDYEPYKSFLDFSVMATTKGFVKAQLSYDKPNIFGSRARSNINLHGNRTLNDNYFGMGNNSGFNDNLWDDDYYNFESISLEASIRTRHPVYQNNESRLDLLSLGGVSYNIPYDDESERLIGEDRPLGFNGGWLNYIGTGVMWENRDNEFAPTRGNQSRLEFYVMPELLLSDYQMAIIYAETRQYFNLGFLSNTTLALRGGFEQAIGDAPYWKLPYIGGESTIRGYPYARFRGNSALFYNVEMRNWLVASEFYDVRLGVHAFSDAGRVFNDQGELRQLFQDHKRTWGMGLALAPYSPDIILRMDYAFSSDMRRLYVGFGYLF
ncbi:MAG: BamA/TamA family outer membrane protein [Balneolales bacterium]